MKIADFKGKKITVMGLGLHGGGVETVRFLCEAGAKVTVTDLKSKEELLPSIEKLGSCKNVEYVFSQHRPEDFLNVDMVVKNPAASWDNKYIQMAISKKIPVEVDSGIFFKLCKNSIIGITGTKGKTTTSSLIYEILKAGGKNAIKVGIGQSPVLDKLKELKKDTVVVFELSSWRLSALGREKISPQVAVITNIYPDHLNYYKSMSEYVKDKKNIYLYQKNDDLCILNADDENFSELDGEIKSKIVKVSKNKISTGRGVYISAGSIYLNDGIDEKKIMDLEEIKLIGEHNIVNILLSIGAVSAMGVKLVDIKRGILNFKGVAHRLEFVRELEGVKYFNDTAATTPEAALFGLSSFSEPVVLICGGSDKNLDMDVFGREITKKAKAVVFLRGMATEKIIHCAQKHLEESHKKHDFKVVDSMNKAVELARMEADPGDVVLLSPGAASFGLFTNEFDRGDQFKMTVKNLK